MEKKLLVAYKIVNDQNKLYGDFRWKVISFTNTLQAGLVFLVIQSSNFESKIVCSLIGIMVSFFLWNLEKRHHTLFTQSRKVGMEIEKKLGISEVGIFSRQIIDKKGTGHHKLTYYLLISTVSSWLIHIMYLIFVYKIKTV